MSTRKPKSVLDQERYTAELSTGQLVLGVCILLMFGLGCFLLGVLIGKFDPTLDQPGQVAVLPPDATQIPVTTVVDAPPPAPAATTAPEQHETAPVESPAELRAPARELAAQPAPSTVTLDPAPQTPAPPAEAANTPKETVAVETENNRVPQPEENPPVTTAAAAPAVTQAESAPTKSTETTARPDTTTATTVTPASSDWKGFGVQVIAVERKRADDALKSLQARTSYKGRVLPGKGILFRVVVGPYAERAVAEKARDDLRGKGYKDAFLLVLK